MLIKEVIISSLNSDGSTYLAPMGLQLNEGSEEITLAPFRPSKTLDNLLRSPIAVANYLDDVRIFAGCLCGKRDWPTRPSEHLPIHHLTAALAYAELDLFDFNDDKVRPRFLARVSHQVNLAPFSGFNRAQAAVIELAILVSRLDRLPREKYEKEIEYLTIAIDKTAGDKERTAWQWLMQKVQQHQHQEATEKVHE